MQCGWRFDEITKMKMNHVSVVGSVAFLTLDWAIKNGTKERVYRVEDWPIGTGMEYSVLMDPVIALLNWLLERGTQPGFVFCR